MDSTPRTRRRSWGVDYLKGDWGCGARTTDPFSGQVALGPSFSVSDPSSAETMYHALSDALLATGRPIVFAADGAGITPSSDPWLVSDGPSFVNQIRPVSSSNSFANLVQIVNTGDQVASQYDKPGFWVDGDIMEVGEITPPAPGALSPGDSTSAVWEVSPATPTAPIASAALTATASYHYSGGTATSRATLPLTVVSAVQSPYLTANLTSVPAVFGQLRSAFAIQAAGAVSTSADQYGTIYEQGAAGPASTVQVAIAGQPGGARGAKAGIVVRNDLSGSATSSPEGVLLYVLVGGSSSTVQMGWNTGNGPDITNTSPSSAAVTDPVMLKLVRSATNGTTYTGYYSTDGGSTWIEVGTPITITSGDQRATQNAGMFQTSGAATPAEADFGGFSVN